MTIQKIIPISFWVMDAWNICLRKRQECRFNLRHRFVRGGRQRELHAYESELPIWRLFRCVPVQVVEVIGDVNGFKAVGDQVGSHIAKDLNHSRVGGRNA